MNIILEGSNSLTEKQAKSMITALKRGIRVLEYEIGNEMKDLFTPQRAKEALRKLESAYALKTGEYRKDQA